MGWLHKMTDVERVMVLRTLIKSDIEPLELLIKMLMVVEPQSAHKGLVQDQFQIDYVI